MHISTRVVQCDQSNKIPTFANDLADGKVLHVMLIPGQHVQVDVPSKACIRKNRLGKRGWSTTDSAQDGDDGIAYVTCELG